MERLTYPVKLKRINKFPIDWLSPEELIYRKLGQLEDIEEKIGCPLKVLLQVFKKGIWVKSDCTKNKIEHWCAQDIKVIDAGCQWDICKIRTTCNKYVGCFNYGKTWALTKEELEK